MEPEIYFKIWQPEQKNHATEAVSVLRVDEIAYFLPCLSHYHVQHAKVSELVYTIWTILPTYCSFLPQKL